MRFIPVQEVYARKFARQGSIDALQLHAGGHCVHIGKLSPGCYPCFVPDRARQNIPVAAECDEGDWCNAACDYCSTGHDREHRWPQSIESPESGTPDLGPYTDALRQLKEAGRQEQYERLSAAIQSHVNPDSIRRRKLQMVLQSCLPDYEPFAFSFSGNGEPLLEIDTIADYMSFFKRLEEETGTKPWYYLYTNGILATEDNVKRLRDMGIDEMRFHPGATNFSEETYEKMGRAVGLIPTVSVETPRWPPHRQKLFEMLPILDGLGVKHLNLTEVEITAENAVRIGKLLPDAEIFNAGFPSLSLYDGELVYDLIEETIAQGYAFSVLDCNSLVKTIQRGRGKWLYHPPVDINELCRF